MPKRKSLAELNCSLAKALDIVGDGWTLLVLRDLFLGARRFADLARSLGIARNILTERLSLLVGEGLVHREGSDNRPLYRLSDKGFAIVPGLVALMQWGDRYYAEAGPPIRIIDAAGKDVAPVTVSSAGGHPLAPQQLFAAAGPGAMPLTRAYIDLMGAARRG